MNRKILLILCVALLAALSLSLAACGSADVYGELAKDGYSVRVKYEPCGAVVNETQNVTVVEVYSEDDVVTVNGRSGIRLLAPDDQRRGDAVFRLAMNDGENNYFSPGWYRERSLRTNEAGEPVDAYGVPTAVSGREQGYVYSGRWDFEEDLLDPATLENGELTLYAAWIPFFTYEIYSVGATGEAELVKKLSKLDFELPEWNERSGKIDMNDMPKMKGYTFRSAYSDIEMTELVEGTLDGDGTLVDLENGIALEHTVRIYTTWLDGEYLKIFDADQLVDEISSDPGGKFILGADIDLSEVEWRSELFNVTFTGVLLGDGHAVSNAFYENGGPLSSAEELFGFVGEGAIIEGVTLTGPSDNNG